MSGSPTESNSKEIQLKLLPLGPRSGPLPVAYPSVVPSTWCNFSALRGLEEVILQPAGHIPPPGQCFRLAAVACRNVLTLTVSGRTPRSTERFHCHWHPQP